MKDRGETPTTRIEVDSLNNKFKNRSYEIDQLQNKNNSKISRINKIETGGMKTKLAIGGKKKLSQLDGDAVVRLKDQKAKLEAEVANGKNAAGTAVIKKEVNAKKLENAEISKQMEGKRKAIADGQNELEISKVKKQKTDIDLELEMKSKNRTDLDAETNNLQALQKDRQKAAL